MALVEAQAKVRLRADTALKLFVGTDIDNFAPQEVGCSPSSTDRERSLKNNRKVSYKNSKYEPIERSCALRNAGIVLCQSHLISGERFKMR